MDDFNHMIFDPKEFSGKRVLVTGGTKGGMGEAIVKRLTLAAATVITTARHTPEELKDSNLFRPISARRPALQKLWKIYLNVLAAWIFSSTT